MEMLGGTASGRDGARDTHPTEPRVGGHYYCPSCGSIRGIFLACCWYSTQLAQLLGILRLAE
jgi:hypothetical protein